MSALREEYVQASQDQVFQFAGSLSNEEKAGLEHQLQAIDPARVNAIFESAHRWSPPQSGIEPLPAAVQASTIDQSPEAVSAWRQHGLDAIARKQVAVVLLAGGQGTRLGSSAPKGCYDIQLPSHKSLFQLQAERIAKLGGVPWYIMTSGPTRAPTEAFFLENSFFGLNPENVIFFEQGTLPCVSFDGKILLESKAKVAEAPDGNGGVYAALRTSGVLDDMRRRGVQHVHMYCVDNSLVKVADPVFIGFSALRGAEIATKVVRKRSADEQVGVIASRDGHPAVIEYSEISAELRNATEDDGLLKLRAANIVNHYYSFSFLERSTELAQDMPYHIARKKIPVADAHGATVKPSEPNGIKFEQFVFDIFAAVPLARFACLEVDRASEFSPVKNGPGSKEDCPETARADLLAEGRRWLLEAGAKSAAPAEISPLVSYAGEGLERFRGTEVALEYIDE